MFTNLASKLTGVFYILKTGLFKRLNTTFDIWFYSPTGLQPAIPLDCVPQWLTLVPKLKGLLHKETCCFKSPWLYGGWFKAWQSLIEKRKLLLQEWRENGVPQSPPNQVAWIENLNAAAALLQVSPLPFFAYITGRKTISDTDISIKTTCVYVICCAQNNKVYVGETGGQTGPRAPIQRFFEHARRSLLVGKGIQQGKIQNNTWRQQLYKDMYKQGLENWVMIPVQVTTPVHRHRDEVKWMNYFTKVYNVQRFWRPWRCPFKDECFQSFTGVTGNVLEKAEKYISSLRQPLPLVEKLFFLITTRKMVPKYVWDKLFLIVSDRFKRTYRWPLPKSIAIPYPSGSPLLHELKKTVSHILLIKNRAFLGENGWNLL